jgi:pimeloyl-ACP methyl ester carboxylesterase
VVLEQLQSLGIGFEAGPETFTENRPTLIMIHGAGGSSQMWQNQVRMLDGDLNVIALDLPGHGKTEGPGRTDISDYARWVGDTLRNVFTERVFLMGHSMGGAVVLDTALSHPEALEGIVLVSTGARLKVAPMFLDGLRESFEETVDTIVAYAHAPGTDKSLIRESARIMKTSGSEVVHGDFLACDRFDARGALERIHHPCLILCGDKDQLTPPAVSNSLARGIEGSRFELVPGAGHLLMLEAYERFNRLVRGFVAEIRN